MVETITNYNSYVDAGHDPEFDKGAFDLKVEKAPFLRDTTQTSRSPYHGWFEN